MNEHNDDHVDDAIDRAVRELVAHDPPARLHAAVMSEIRATSAAWRGSWVRWSLVATSVAAALILALTPWNQPREDTSRRPHGHESTIVKSPVAPGADDPAAAAVPVRAGRRRNAALAVPGESNAAALVPRIEITRIRMDSVEIATIPLDEVPIRPIHIEDITVGER